MGVEAGTRYMAGARADGVGRLGAEPRAVRHDIAHATRLQ